MQWHCCVAIQRSSNPAIVVADPRRRIENVAQTEGVQRRKERLDEHDVLQMKQGGKGEAATVARDERSVETNATLKN